MMAEERPRSESDDPFNLERFVEAQETVIDIVRAELRAGLKRTHWMWFIFPQIAGLGQSSMARRYAIASAAEARAYVSHPLLGARLVELTAIVNALQDRTVHEIFGSPDDMKFHSSMTLFATCSDDAAPYREALKRYFRGATDDGTLSRLG